MLWKHHRMVEIFNLPSTPFVTPLTNDPRCSERPLARGKVLTEVGGEISTKTPPRAIQKISGLLMHLKTPETLWSVLVDWFREASSQTTKHHWLQLCTLHILISFITPRLFFTRQLEHELNHVSHLCLSHHGAWQTSNRKSPLQKHQALLYEVPPNNEHTIVQPTSKQNPVHSQLVAPGKETSKPHVPTVMCFTASRLTSGLLSLSRRAMSSSKTSEHIDPLRWNEDETFGISCVLYIYIYLTIVTHWFVPSNGNIQW